MSFGQSKEGMGMCVRGWVGGRGGGGEDIYCMHSISSKKPWSCYKLIWNLWKTGSLIIR